MLERTRYLIDRRFLMQSVASCRWIILVQILCNQLVVSVSTGLPECMKNHQWPHLIFEHSEEHLPGNIGAT